ncbi:MAG: hypothetical protein II776_00400 [Clostridia bacterium]|nr:hypothetical protein [Clostridia bacterium]
MGTASLLFGFLFLIEPGYFTLDFLPDFIGYLLIAHGLYRLSFLEDRIWNARRWAQYLALISVMKIFSSVFVLTSNVESTRLSAMFLFAVAEGWMGFLLVDNLFKGVQYLAVRQDSDLALKGIDVAAGFAKVFMPVRSFLGFLPAAMILFFSNVDADPALVEGYATLKRTYLTARLVVMILSAAAFLFLGIYTARILFAYAKRVRSDKPFVASLRDLYRRKVTDNEDARVRIHVREGFFLFFIAAVFFPDFYMDHIGILPSFIGVLLVYCGVRNLSKGVRLPAFLSPALIVSLIVSFASYGLRTACLILWQEKFAASFAAFLPGRIFAALGQAALGFSAFAALFSVWKTAAAETGYRYTLYGVFTGLLWAGVLGTGVFTYAFPARSGVVQAVQIGLALIALYLHKKSMDDVRGEVEYKRM